MRQVRWGNVADYFPSGDDRLLNNIPTHLISHIK